MNSLFDIDPNALSSPPSSPKPASHPVYSDFSHIASATGIGSTRFAAGLREENPEELINRILPMARVVPGEKKERVIREKKKEEKICMRPDCVARREAYAEMNHENEYLRIKLRDVESRVAAAKNKVALGEKSVDMAESKNEMLRGQIDEAQAKILSIESVVEKSEARNQILRSQFSALLQDIENLKQQEQTYRKQMENILAYELGPQVVFTSKQKPIPPNTQSLRDEVRQLDSRSSIGAGMGGNPIEVDSDEDDARADSAEGVYFDERNSYY